MEASEALSAIRDRIVNSFGPEQILLFGSRAEGSGRYDSDLDLLVVFPHVENKRAMRVSLYNSLRGIPFAKDIFVAGQDEIKAGTCNEVEREALKRGITVYERGAHIAYES